MKLQKRLYLTLKITSNLHYSQISYSGTSVAAKPKGFSSTVEEENEVG